MIPPADFGDELLTRLIFIALTFLMAPPPTLNRAASEDEDEDVRRYRGPLP